MVLKLVSINEEIYGSFNNSNQELATDKKFRDQNLTELLKQDTKHSETLIHFFRIISLCHSAIPEIEIETDETPHLEAKENDIKYQAPSPDELALVNGAKDIGIRFEVINTIYEKSIYLFF